MSANTSKSDTMPHNTNRWSTKQLVVMALMAALAILLSFFSSPLPFLPGASFLKLSFELVPIAIVGFAFGAGPGVMVGLICAFAHAAIATGNWVGAIMSSIVAVAFVVPSALIYKRNHTYKGAMIGLCVATIVFCIAIIVANLVIDPIFYGMPFDAVVALILPAILPFNILKGVAVSVIVALCYKSISNFITPSKDQVKGK